MNMQTEDGEGSVGANSQNSHDISDQVIPGSGWKFEGEADPGNNGTVSGFQNKSDAITWSASEYVAHHKSVGWFASLGLVIASLSLIVYVLSREWVSALVIVIIGLSFGIFGARQPRVLQYALDDRGVHVGDKLYPYNQLKSFSILQEGPIHSLQLMPLQRFMPPLSVYYGQEDEDKIIDVIGRYIPHEERQHDLVDRLMSKIRF